MPLRPGPTPTQVHVWWVDLDSVSQPPEVLAGLLSTDEHERAARFGREDLRGHYLVRRAMLRLVLAGYVGAPAPDLRFEYGPRGKPSLVAPAPLQFNLSHSGTWLVVAVTAAEHIGVDVEQERTVRHVERLIGHAWSSAEHAAFEALPETERTAFFFQLWTRKEACVKATGEGLSLPTRRVEVLSADGPGLLLPEAGDGAGAERWRVRDLDAPAGYRAALAVALPASGHGTLGPPPGATLPAAARCDIVELAWPAG